MNSSFLSHVGRRLVNAALRQDALDFQKMASNSVRAQELAFRTRMEQLARTRFGLDHGIHPQISLREYQRQVPLRTYDGFRPYLEQIKAGTTVDLLAPGHPKYWGRTGGTTVVSSQSGDSDKLIPIYQPGIDQSRKTFRLALSLHLAEHPTTDLLGRTLLLLGSSQPLSRLPAGPGGPGLLSGFMSSIMVKEMLPTLKAMILPGSRVDHLPSWEEKIHAILEMTLRRRVSIAAAMPPWLSAFFKTVQEKTGKGVLEIWPDLRLILHSGVAMENYRSEILKSLGPPAPGSPLPSFKNAFGATEGNFAVQARDADQDMTLVCDSVFFEFVKLEDYHLNSTTPPRYSLAEINPHEDYVLVLTTPGGLSSYVIGDTVQFERASERDGYGLRISGRTAQFINLGGEKVSAEQVIHTIRRVNERVKDHLREHLRRENFAALGQTVSDPRIEEFTLFPGNAATAEGSYIPAHEWILEVSPASIFPSAESASLSSPHLQKFKNSLMQAIDETLSELNPLYRVRRQSQFGSTPLLGEPTIHLVPPGTYARWQKETGREGGHYKIPRISTQVALKASLLASQPPVAHTSERLNPRS
jgi:hypothetical protein